MPATMHWFRRGLRLHDQPALVKSTQIAKETGAKVYPVYVLDPDCYQLLRCSVNRANFLLEALRDLDSQLRVRYSSRLFVVAGKPQDGSTENLGFPSVMWANLPKENLE